MKKVFDEVGILDKKCYNQYGLSEDILMEHAATSMLDFIQKKFKKNAKILIISGVGNNGADGIALARLLQGNYKVKLYLPFGVKSIMAELQLKRAKLIGTKITNTYPLKPNTYSLLIDCLFGSGLSRELDEKSENIIRKLNKLKGYKLACDIPSGINKLGQIPSVAFEANKTITMGALKKSLFTDNAKDFVGKIKVANLGVQRNLYEDKSNCFLLEKKDLKLPIRDKKNTHKGTFGHLSVVVGEKKGAGLISCKTALNFGVGLITAITKRTDIPNSIMSSDNLPTTTTAIAIGMGLGNCKYKKEIVDLKLPIIVDADMFYDKTILNLLNRDNIVLTPHPKEFCNLLKISNIATITIE